MKLIYSPYEYGFVVVEYLADTSSFLGVGVMKLEATKFRPRQVVKHVLQTAAASLQKILTLEGHIMEEVPVEVNISAHS